MSNKELQVIFIKCMQFKYRSHADAASIFRHPDIHSILKSDITPNQKIICHQTYSNRFSPKFHNIQSARSSIRLWRPFTKTSDRLYINPAFIPKSKVLRGRGVQFWLVKMLHAAVRIRAKTDSLLKDRVTIINSLILVILFSKKLYFNSGDEMNVMLTY